MTSKQERRIHCAASCLKIVGLDLEPAGNRSGGV
jgi:hypothetical protein